MKSIRVRTPIEMRPFYYHLRNEKALGARPNLYKKLLNHWNTESGYTIKTYDDFERAFPITQYLNSIIGKRATNTISSMAGSIPPYFVPLASTIEQTAVVRTLIGEKPEYSDI